MTGPPRRIMIGFDGSPGAYDAVALAQDLAPGAAALLVYVPPHEDPVARHYESVKSPPGFFDQALAGFSASAIETRTYVGASPAHVLCDLTDREALDLVVVGSPHRSVIGRALIGSVAEALLHGSGAPVVLAPRSYADGDHAPPRRIAVAYDTSPESDTALRHAELLALAIGSELEVLTVVASQSDESDALVESRSARVEPYALVEKAVGRLDRRVEVRARMLTGAIAPALAAACAENEVDLLVVGSQDYGPLRRALLGSVANKLVHIAPCPVLLVPRP